MRRVIVLLSVVPLALLGASSASAGISPAAWRRWWRRWWRWRRVVADHLFIEPGHHDA